MPAYAIGAVMLLLVILAWYYTRRYNTTLVTVRDGAMVSIACQGQVEVISADYTTPGGAAADVAALLQRVLAAGHSRYVVNAAAFAQPPGGVLSFRYKCAGPDKAGFRPVPVSVCARRGRDDYYGVAGAHDTPAWASPRDAAGTVAWDPYSTQSRISLERYAESPEAAEEPNPVSGLGRTSSVRAMGDRYRRNEALTRLSVYELQPEQPGYMEEVSDHAMSLMAAVTRRSPAVAGGAPPCLLAGTDIDSDYFTDGYYGTAVLGEAFSSGGPAEDLYGGLKEGLTSVRRPAPNTLTASRTGLGSIRQDPRFEPGPESRTPDGDASWSNGASAGGPTSGGYSPSVFAATNNWDWHKVHGFGDGSMFGRNYPVEAIITERSLW